MPDTVPVLGGRITARQMRPTLAHRLAISPGILGTVYAVNDALECRYFDYDWDAAVAFAGITPGRDPRFAPPRGRCSYVRTGCTEADARPGRRYVWILKEG
jgi:hypothetical protein